MHWRCYSADLDRNWWLLLPFCAIQPVCPFSSDFPHTTVAHWIWLVFGGENYFWACRHAQSKPCRYVCGEDVDMLTSSRCLKVAAMWLAQWLFELTIDWTFYLRKWPGSSLMSVQFYGKQIHHLHVKVYIYCISTVCRNIKWSLILVNARWVEAAAFCVGVDQTSLFQFEGKSSFSIR